MQTEQTGAATAQANAQFLVFQLGVDAFGIDILKVREIRRWEGVRTIPDAPGAVKGVLDLRGTMVPVLDLRVRLGAQASGYGPTTVVIIVSLEGAAGQQQLVGLVVDAVSDVLDSRASEIKASPSAALGIGNGILTGMVSIEGGMLLVLDVERILEDAAVQELPAAAARDFADDHSRGDIG